MKLRVMSDLHLDFHVSKYKMAYWLECLPEVECDVVVVAGDIAEAPTLELAVQLLRERFFNRQLVFVLGNHDYWKDRRRTQDFYHRQKLHHSKRVIDGKSIVAVTGWHLGRPCTADGHMIAEADEWIPRRAVLDENSLSVHLPADVVVTHHLPHWKSVPERFREFDNRAFLNPLLTPLVERGPDNGGCKLWIHGHTHDSCDYTLPGGTRVVCNPYGYAGHEVNPAWDPCKVVEI